MTDFYQITQTLPLQDLELLLQVRAFMENKVAPIVNKHWLADSFPLELLPEFKKLDICNKNALLTGLIVCPV